MEGCGQGELILEQYLPEGNILQKLQGEGSLYTEGEVHKVAGEKTLYLSES